MEFSLQEGLKLSHFLLKLESLGELVLADIFVQLVVVVRSEIHHFGNVIPYSVVVGKRGLQTP